MANNCYNHISIEGDKEELKSFIQEMEVKTNGYDKYAELCSIYGKEDDDGKWFDMDVDDTSDNGIVTIYGDSAWCPCLKIFGKISEKYKSFKIHYEYEEPGCDFAGWADIEDGGIDDNCFTYYKGMVEMGEEERLINDVEFMGFESEEELLSSDLYLAANTDELRGDILEEYRNTKNN